MCIVLPWSYLMCGFVVLQIKTAKRSTLGLGPGLEGERPNRVQDIGKIFCWFRFCTECYSQYKWELHGLNVWLQTNQEQIKATVKLEKQETLQKPTQETHPLQRPKPEISKQIQV